MRPLPADTRPAGGFRVHDLTLRDIRYEMRMEPLPAWSWGCHLGRLELDLKGMDLDASPGTGLGDLLLSDTHIRMASPPGGTGTGLMPGPGEPGGRP